MAYLGNDLLPRGGPVNDKEEEQIGLIQGEFRKAKRGYRDDMLTQIENQLRQSDPNFQVRGSIKDREAALVSATGYTPNPNGFLWMDAEDRARLEGQAAAVSDAANQRPSERFKVTPSQNDKVGKMIAQGGLDDYFAGNKSINRMEREKIAGAPASNAPGAGQRLINAMDEDMALIKRNAVEASDPQTPNFDELVAKYGTNAGKASAAFMKGYEESAKGISKTPLANTLLDVQWYMRNPEEILPSAWENAKQTGEEIANTVRREGSQALKEASQAVDEFFDNPVGSTEQAVNNFGRFLDNGGNAVDKAATETYDWMDRAGGEVVDTVTDRVSDAVDTVTDRASSVADDVTDFFSGSVGGLFGGGGPGYLPIKLTGLAAQIVDGRKRKVHSIQPSQPSAPVGQPIIGYGPEAISSTSASALDDINALFRT